MATKERESAEGASFRCAHCGQTIVHDVVRVDAGRLFHMRCFRRHVHGADVGLHACPECDTLGSRWADGTGTWIPCGFCGGSGYLSEAVRILAAALVRP